MSDADLNLLALKSQADEHADNAGAAKRLEDFQNATAPGAPVGPTPEEEKAAADKAQLKAMEEVIMGQLPKVCAVVWGMIDKLAIQYAGPQYAQTPEERANLAQATVPVVLKYLPKDLSWLATTPEGALILTAGTIYAFKFALGEPAKLPEVPPAASPLPSPEATA